MKTTTQPPANAKKLLSLRQMANRLRKDDHFLILTHMRPDGDAVGSAAALALGLRALGKTAWVLENPDITPRYRPFWEGLTAPPEYAPSAVVCADVADPGLLPPNAAPFAGRIGYSIDHHGTNKGFAVHNCVETRAAACGELIWELWRYWGLSLSPAAADALYVAVSTDTGCFRYTNTTARTHRITATLFDAGANAARLNKLLFETVSPARLAIETAVQNTLTYHAHGRVAIARVTPAMIAAAGAGEDDMENLGGLTRRIEGVRIGVTLTQRSDGIKVSVRSEAPVSAAALCTAFGGGGHPRAAGCTLPGDMQSAARAILERIYRDVPDLDWSGEELPWTRDTQETRNTAAN